MTFEYKPGLLVDIYECPECGGSLASEYPLTITHHADGSHWAEYAVAGANRTHVASIDPCPEWHCPDLSAEDRREGKTCPEHPCTCARVHTNGSTP